VATVDPLEAVLAYVGQDADLRALIGPRLAARHKYGLPDSSPERWATGTDGLTLTPTTGEAPDLDAGMARLRLEARAYGATPRRASAIATRLRALCDAFVRTTVTTHTGVTALLYWIVPDDAPEHGYDTDIRMDFVRLPLRVAVAGESV
jgi:hypothetical protein